MSGGDMDVMEIQISEIRENSKLDLHFELDATFLSEVLIDTDYTSEKAVTKVTLDRVGRSRAFRVEAQIEIGANYICGKCLEKRMEMFAGKSDFVLMAKSDLMVYLPNEEVELAADDLDVMSYEGESIDLSPLVRETILEVFPTHASCSETLKETCQRSYEENIGAAVVKELEEAQVDLRWGPLLALKKKQKKV